MDRNEAISREEAVRTISGNKERPAFTRKELEDADLGWVFNCEGIEIEEVE